jgi:segregation and condensation protein A
MSVREAVVLMADELTRAGGAATFRELTAGCRHRSEVVVCFLALLELYRTEQIELQQARHFSDVTVTANPDAPAVSGVLADVESYEVRHVD